MGYRAYHVTEKTIWRGKSKHDELIDDGCNYAIISCLHYISSAHIPSKIETPLDKLEELMSDLSMEMEYGDDKALLLEESINDFIENLKVEYDKEEFKEELDDVIYILEEIKQREPDSKCYTITFI